MPKSNGSKRFASKAELLKKLDGLKSDVLAREELYLESPVDEWVLVWELWGDEREAYLASLTGKSKQRIPIGGKRGQIREVEIESDNNPGQLRLCALALKDENGVSQWTEDELRRRLPARAIDRIHEVAYRLSFPSAEVQAEVGKGSPRTSVVASSSRSPFISDTEASESSSTG